VKNNISKLLIAGSFFCAFGFGSANAFNGHAQQGGLVVPLSIVQASDKAADAKAESFIDTMASDAIGFLGDASLSDAAKQKRFRSLLTRSFDINTIGRFALGRYWRSFSKEQRDE